MQTLWGDLGRGLGEGCMDPIGAPWGRHGGSCEAYGIYGGGVARGPIGTPWGLWGHLWL